MSQTFVNDLRDAINNPSSAKVSFSAQDTTHKYNMKSVEHAAALLPVPLTKPLSTTAHINLSTEPVLVLFNKGLPAAESVNSIGYFKRMIQAMTETTLLKDAQFGGTHGLEIGYDILYDMYSVLRARSVYAAKHTKANTGKAGKSVDVGKLIVEECPKMSKAISTSIQSDAIKCKDSNFANFLARIIIDDKLMTLLMEAKNKAHDELALDLQTKHIITGGTRQDLTTVASKDLKHVSAKGNEDEKNVQICCVFKALKIHSYALQTDNDATDLRLKDTKVLRVMCRKTMMSQEMGMFEGHNIAQELIDLFFKEPVDKIYGLV